MHYWNCLFLPVVDSESVLAFRLKLLISLSSIPPTLPAIDLFPYFPTTYNNTNIIIAECRIIRQRTKAGIFVIYSVRRVDVSRDKSITQQQRGRDMVDKIDLAREHAVDWVFVWKRRKARTKRNKKDNRFSGFDKHFMVAFIAPHFRATRTPKNHFNRPFLFPN